MKKIFLLAGCFLLMAVAKAQPYSTSADIYLGLRKLNVLGSVLYVAAHPDDENTRLISYFSKDKLYRTGYLSLTRGDGGQNLIGDEQGIELGLIRTQELLSARNIDGGEQFFTRAFDFGYSKTPEETFTKWDKEKILSDVVWVIRQFQPDVIITRFPTTGEGGHGHHTASAILASEAFQAAADPSKFPAQLKWVKPWQAKRILWNGFNFNNATPPADAFRIDVGGYNPVLGKSYGEIAAISRSQHKSQGFGSSGNRGEVYEFFRPMGGTAPTQDLFEEIETGWKKAGAPEITGLVQSIINAYDFLHPEKSVKDLVHLYQAINRLPESPWKKKKLQETASLVEACSGLYADATTSVPYVAQTDSVRINIVLNNRLGSVMHLKGVSMEGFDSTLAVRLEKNNNLLLPKTVFVPASMPITQPYWLDQEMQEGYYTVNEQQQIGQPDVQPAFTVRFQLNIEGVDIPVARRVRYKFNDPVKGEVYQPFIIVPPYTLKLDPPIRIGMARKVPFEKTFTSYRNNNSVELFRSGNGSKQEKHLLQKNQVLVTADTVSFDLPATDKNGIVKSAKHAVDLPLLFTSQPQGAPVKDMITIQYDHIPTIRYFQPAELVIKNLDLETAGKKIGYIVGAGDKVPQALEQMGYEVYLLTDKELARNNLGQFDAILSGVRAYNTNEWLNKYHEKLMAYVRNGGNLIVQYNTSNNIGPVRARIGPYAFDISRNRITDENAPVSFINPDHQVLKYPNTITAEDFKGWIQERSVYHASKMDTAFRPVLRMNDRGEQPDDGSLIIAPYGKGFFTYTGLVFFRQLPAGVPGAYRLLANLIALNRKKTF